MREVLTSFSFSSRLSTFPSTNFPQIGFCLFVYLFIYLIFAEREAGSPSTWHSRLASPSRPGRKKGCIHNFWLPPLPTNQDEEDDTYLRSLREDFGGWNHIPFISPRRTDFSFCLHRREREAINSPGILPGVTGLSESEQFGKFLWSQGKVRAWDGFLTDFDPFWE